MAIVYQHRKPGEVLPFYIGISDNNPKRPYKTDRGYNRLWTNIYKKYGREVDILINGCTYDQAKEVEVGLIAAYGRIDKGTGILANMTDGGEGTIGKVIKEVTRKKISKVHSGKVVSEEAKNKMRKAKIGKVNSEEQNKNIGKAQIGKVHSQETKNKMSENSGQAKTVFVIYSNGESKPFPSIRNTSKHFGVSEALISLIVSGHRKLSKQLKDKCVTKIYIK